jgi:hypothetical protein
MATASTEGGVRKRLADKYGADAFAIPLCPEGQRPRNQMRKSVTNDKTQMHAQITSATVMKLNSALISVCTGVHRGAFLRKS